jgi:hypothetical protein
MQCSPLVQASPSEHTPFALKVCVQPAVASQASVVHGSPSSQLAQAEPALPQMAVVVPSWHKLFASIQPPQQTPLAQWPVLQPV